MYTLSLLSALLASTLISAAPLNPELVNRPGTQGEINNAAAIQDAAALANERILKMEATLNNPNTPENKQRIETAFGPNGMHAKPRPY